MKILANPLTASLCFLSALIQITGCGQAPSETAPAIQQQLLQPTTATSVGTPATSYNLESSVPCDTPNGACPKIYAFPTMFAQASTLAIVISAMADPVVFAGSSIIGTSPLNCRLQICTLGSAACIAHAQTRDNNADSPAYQFWSNDTILSGSVTMNDTQTFSFSRSIPAGAYARAYCNYSSLWNNSAAGRPKIISVTTTTN